MRPQPHRNPPTIPAPLLPAALLATLLATLFAASACESIPALRESKAWHGSTPIYATYHFGQLKTELPPGTDLETVNAVTRAVLHRQGHTIQEASYTPSDGRIIALGNSQLPYDRIKVYTKYDGGGVIMTINIDPATESRSRTVLEAILNALQL